MLSINTNNKSKFNDKGSDIGLLKDKLNSDIPLDFKNIKTENFTLKNENEVAQAKERSRKNTILSQESGADAPKNKNAMSHRKTRSLELNNKDLDFIKQETNGSNKSNARVNNDDESNIWRINIMLKNDVKINETNQSKANNNKNKNVEELKEKMNKASFLDTSINNINHV